MMDTAFLQLFPLLLLSIPFAIGNYHVAKRIDRAEPMLWFILSLVPFVSFFFLSYAFYKVTLQILDNLRVKAPA